MANDVADYTSSVVIQSGTVTISGTATVQITGTPTVSVTGNPQVQISNTPAVTISSGTVTIANASIAVINAAGVSLTTAMGQKNLGLATTGAGGALADTAITVPADVQDLILVPEGGANDLMTRVAVIGANTNITYFDQRAGFTVGVTVPIGLIPVLGSKDGTVTIRISATSLMSVRVYGLSASAPEWMQWYPLPQQKPNQFPLYSQPSLVDSVAQWLIAPVANVQITIFAIYLFWANADTTRPLYVGHNPTLPGAGLTPNRIFAQLSPTQGIWDLKAAQLPRGSGLYIEQLNGATLAAAVTVIYSLS